jgi:UDP-N-acetylmuramoyl-tripeptide--D-alanyl-D-alanine ligase
VLATVYALGGDLGVAGLALADLGGLPGRGARYRLASGALLIDESYNANAASMAATLDVLGHETAGRRIAVLGEMRELGTESAALHAGIAEPLLAARPDHVVLVGGEMAALVDAVRGKVSFEHVADTAAAIERVRPMIAADDAILVKGSNGVGLSALVTALRNA